LCGPEIVPFCWQCNDDLGTMSAWYLFSALGLYPDTPGYRLAPQPDTAGWGTHARDLPRAPAGVVP
jgi:hypothetical protein